MRLQKATTWAETYFEEGSRPDPRTARGWIEKQIVPGRMINGVAYVDLDEWEQQPCTGNPLADKILKRAAANDPKTKKQKATRLAR